MRFTLSLLTAVGLMIVAAPPSYAEDLAGSVALHVTETLVAPTQGVLRRDEVVAIHELRADRGAVMLERAGPGAVSSQVGDVLIALEAGPRAHVYCDLNNHRALAGGFIPCFEDQDGDGLLETRYLGSTRTNFPSTFLMLAGPDSIEPAAYREAEAHERPIVRVGLEPCALGRRPTFKLVIATETDEWSSGGRCQPAEQTLQNIGIGLATEDSGSNLTYRLVQPLPAGSEVLLFPSF